MRPSESQLSSLKTAALKYHQALPGSPAADYLGSRGLNPDLVVRFGLGYVDEPDIGHDMFRGRLSIPYTRQTLAGGRIVLGIKFRRLGDGSGAKYLGTPGFKPHLFNTRDAIDNENEICICEGELDAVAASINGIPAVAAPGATTWQKAWNPIFLGYETVFILADGDPLKFETNCTKGCARECVGHSPGLDFASSIAESLPNAKIIPMLEGEDVNSMIQNYGADKVKGMIGR